MIGALVEGKPAMTTWESSSAAYSTPGQGDTWAQDAANRGKTGSQRLLDVDTGPPPPEVQAALNLTDAALAVRRRRLILADDKPVEIASSYYPADIAAGTALAEAKRIKGGAITALAQTGHELEYVEEAITARTPTAEEAELLHIDPTAPVIVLARAGADAAGVVVQYDVNVMVAAETEPLTYRMRRSA